MALKILAMRCTSFMGHAGHTLTRKCDLVSRPQNSFLVLRVDQMMFLPMPQNGSGPVIINSTNLKKMATSAYLTFYTLAGLYFRS